jgi:DNA-binding response OmpR family regulator
MTRILLVEKDEKDAALICEALGERRDWQVVRVGTVLDAIRTAGETPFDAAVLDHELPDGTGMDLLDFLRIGSPGIRIVMLSRNGSESLAFQALSHGAGDYLVKDHHLVQELPRRMDALLDHVDARAAFIETLRPAVVAQVAEDVEEREPEKPAPREDPRAVALGKALDGALGGIAFAAGVFDARGQPLATRLVPPLDPNGLGFGLASLHAQVGALWGITGLKPTSYIGLIHVEGGLLGITAVPGPYVVSLLFAQGTPHERALKSLVETARKVSAALNG